MYPYGKIAEDIYGQFDDLLFSLRENVGDLYYVLRRDV